MTIEKPARLLIIVGLVLSSIGLAACVSKVSPDPSKNTNIAILTQHQMQTDQTSLQEASNTIIKQIILAKTITSESQITSITKPLTEAADRWETDIAHLHWTGKTAAAATKLRTALSSITSTLNRITIPQKGLDTQQLLNQISPSMVKLLKASYQFNQELGLPITNTSSGTPKN